MSYHRGSFHGERDHLLERFAHRGTPAALQDQLRDVKPKKTSRRCRFFQLNQSLFEKSQT